MEEQQTIQNQSQATASAHDDFDWSVDKRNVAAYSNDKRQELDQMYQSTFKTVDDAELRLYLVDPRTVLSAYAPTLTDEQADGLALASPDDALILVVAHPSSEGVSVNLLAPVIVNQTTGAASQVILEDQDYPLRAPLG